MAAPPTVDERIGRLLAPHGAEDAARIVEHIAARYVPMARLLGFDQAPAAASDNGATPAEIETALRGLADLATELGDLSSAHDLLLATAAAEEARDCWDRMHAPKHPGGADADTMFAVYDLKAGPVTYDFIQFLVLAEKFRRISGRKHLHVVIPPGDHHGFRNFSQRDRMMSEAHKEWRLRQLLIRACYLVPACIAVTRFRSRGEAKAFLSSLDRDSVFPPAFNLDQPICPYFLAFVMQFATQGPDIRSLAAPPVATALVRRLYRDLAGEKPVVAITLRQSEFQEARNSRMDQWLQFAVSCREKGLFPLFIPDTEAILRGAAVEIGGFPVFTLAALSIGFRAAAYQESWLNMLANGGPYTICLYNARARFSMFKLLVPGIMTASAAYHVGQGLMPGSQLPFAGPLQRLVWEDDSLEALERELSYVMAQASGPQEDLRAITAARG
jgi:hypothetical protein